ncbi:MAG TPA: WYL domain-containing protein, partial [Acidimicrobiales bacterium]
AGRERPSHQVVAIVHASADGVRRGIGRWGHVEAVDETTCRVVMHVDNLAWPLMALGSVGAELEVEGPPALIETMADWAARFGRATADA